MTDTNVQELEKKLIGKKVILGPHQAFFYEDNQQYVLNAYGDAEKAEFTDKQVTIQEGWKLEPTLRNIRAGVLRVIDEKGQDITGEFGGPALPLGRKVALVEVAKRADPEDQRDRKLLKILDDINPIDIIKNLTSLRPSYEVLERIYQLELAGENPAYRSRQAVLDGIKLIMENTTGMGTIKKEEGDTLTANKR